MKAFVDFLEAILSRQPVSLRWKGLVHKAGSDRCRYSGIATKRWEGRMEKLRP